MKNQLTEDLKYDSLSNELKDRARAGAIDDIARKEDAAIMETMFNFDFIGERDRKANEEIAKAADAELIGFFESVPDAYKVKELLYEEDEVDPALQHIMSILQDRSIPEANKVDARAQFNELMRIKMITMKPPTIVLEKKQ